VSDIWISLRRVLALQACSASNLLRRGRQKLFHTDPTYTLDAILVEPHSQHLAQMRDDLNVHYHIQEAISEQRRHLSLRKDLMRGWAFPRIQQPNVLVESRILPNLQRTRPSL
jgi:hypothetical protein